MKIHSVGAELFCVVKQIHRQTDRQTYGCDKANSCFLQFCEHV